MLIYRLAQADGDEKSKDWVQLTLVISNDSGGEVKQKVIRMPKTIFIQMATYIKQNELPFVKIEET